MQKWWSTSWVQTCYAKPADHHVEHVSKVRWRYMKQNNESVWWMLRMCNEPSRVHVWCTSGTRLAHVWGMSGVWSDRQEYDVKTVVRRVTSVTRRSTIVVISCFLTIHNASYDTKPNHVTAQTWHGFCFTLPYLQHYFTSTFLHAKTRLAWPMATTLCTEETWSRCQQDSPCLTCGRTLACQSQWQL